MRLCRLEELSEPGARGFRVGEGDWPLRGFLVRAHGHVRAYLNRCPHARHPLDLLPDRFLDPSGSVIVCSSHGAQFRPDDGYCTAGPCAGQALQSIPVEVIDGWVVLGVAFDSSRYDP